MSTKKRFKRKSKDERESIADLGACPLPWASFCGFTCYENPVVCDYCRSMLTVYMDNVNRLHGNTLSPEKRERVFAKFDAFNKFRFGNRFNNF